MKEKSEEHGFTAAYMKGLDTKDRQAVAVALYSCPSIRPDLSSARQRDLLYPPHSLTRFQ